MSWFSSEKQFFGVPLNEQLDREDRLTPPKPPTFVEAALKHLVIHGLSLEDLFSSDDKATGVEKLRKKMSEYKNGRIPEMSKLESEESLHDVVVVLKEWLIALPEPLIPIEQAEQFRKANSACGG